ncbi:MAG TPA: hypothetical protein VL463_24525 [Kofleriaceae bacterium]|nr:hypothetical protein [Kofleriaceae bacterium]
MPRLAYSLLVIAACGGGAPSQPDAFVDGGAIQMNDVSILFPLNGAASTYLAASDAGARGVLLPPALYDAVGHLSGSTGSPPPGGIADAVYGDLHVVAIRIDPCFGNACDDQLRLVFQEVKDDGSGGATTFDSGLHAFYRISREDVVTIAHAIGSLRASNSSGERLGGLAPHPILVTQGMNGAFADGLRTIVLRYAGASNLVRVTKMSATQVGFSWEFSGFDVSDANAPHFTPMVIPTLAGAEGQNFFRGFANDTIDGQFNPATTSADDLTGLADETHAQSMSPSDRAKAFAALVRIDHPAHDSPDTIDCASCHLATPISKLVAPRFGLDEAHADGVFEADGVHVLPSELGATFDPSGPFNLHAFSYVDRSPAINQRTVNETAAVVELLSAP